MSKRCFCCFCLENAVNWKEFNHDVAVKYAQFMKMYYLFPLETEDTKGYQVVFTYFLVQLQIAIFYRNEIFSELFYLPTYFERKNLIWANRVKLSLKYMFWYDIINCFSLLWQFFYENKQGITEKMCKK